MAKKRTKQTSTNSTWRNIQQSFTGRAVTKHARKRRWMLNLKFVGGLAGLALVGAGVWAGVQFLKSDSFARIMAGGSAPVRSVYLETDGVLDEDWLNDTISIPNNIELMAVDIEGIQAVMAEDGQVRSALVERVFPDTIRIRLEEQHPVLRIVMQDASGKKYLRLLSRDGEVYMGQGYPKHLLRNLPFAQGVTLRRKSGGSYEPVEGIPQVADFMEKVRILMPERFTDWKAISLHHFDASGQSGTSRYVVSTRKGYEITFSPDNVEEQLARLQSILSRLESQRRRIDRIDLSLDDAVVKLADSSPSHGPARFR
ncbi:MAG: FtsQ-type POTRA domain-containing protein [Verrucomicrobiota bacterium]